MSWDILLAMRRLPFALPALLLVAGCPGPETVADAGFDGGTPIVDTGVDAPVIGEDSGIDAPSTDAGTDAGAPLPDGSILPPRDAGDPFGDTGTLPPPAWVPIEIAVDAACPAFTACGGDEVGTWDVTGGCLEIEGPGAVLEMCPGATFDVEARGRGRVTFDGDTAVRAAQSEIIATVFVPTLCASFVGGCPAIEDLIQMQTPDSACVTTTAGCVCEGRQHFVIDDADGYTIEGDQIVSATLMRRWDYCVMDGMLRYQDVSDEVASREPGIIELGMP